MTVDHPRRFGLFATLPLPDIDASLAELRHAFDALSADGIVLYTNYRDVYLGDTRFSPLMEELNRRKAVVFVHPTVCHCCLGVQPEIATAMLEFPHDTTRTIVSMLVNGTFKSYPGIRFIFSHAGGTVPFLVNRISIWPMPRLAPDGLLPFLKRQYFDLALSANPQAMTPLLSLVDDSHVLLGTDYPFAPAASVRAAVEGISTSSLTQNSISRIQRENALLLFLRFSSSHP
jgi:predicted TIM-barrel fold metal-dependent hydrolase